jgi:hypothetical protein
MANNFDENYPSLYVSDKPQSYVKAGNIPVPFWHFDDIKQAPPPFDPTAEPRMFIP